MLKKSKHNKIVLVARPGGQFQHTPSSLFPVLKDSVTEFVAILQFQVNQFQGGFSVLLWVVTTLST